MFDIIKLISLYRENNLDEGRVYLFNNFKLFTYTKKLKVQDDDAEQDLYMKVDDWLQKHCWDIDSEQKPNKQMGYVLNKANRMMLDILKKRNREYLRYDTINDYPDSEGDSNVQESFVYRDFFEDVNKDFEREVIERAVLDLPDEEARLIALMLDKYGYKQADIARINGINFQKISKLYKSALINLQDKLEGLLH